MDIIYLLCLLGTLYTGHVAVALDRRFIVEGTNLIYANNNIHDSHNFYVTHVNVVSDTDGCNFQGVHYRHGQAVRGADGCSLWSCSSSGMIVNSHMCPQHQPTSTDSIRCNYQGVNYAYADTFRHQDGCNKCLCAQTIECTSLPECSLSQAGCLANGHHYSYGEHYNQPDGCNVCVCTKDGNMCTHNTCGTTQSPTAGCHANGHHYSYGEHYNQPDGCNVCVCTKDGNMCTHNTCGTTQSPIAPPTCVHRGVKYSLGQTYHTHHGCVLCRCMRQGFACSHNQCTSHAVTTVAPSATPQSIDCFKNGKHIPDGQKFYHEDGCNICTCFSGEIECGSDKTCGTTPVPTVGHQCHVAGQVYNEGDVIPSYPCYHCVCKNGKNICNNICSG